MTITAKGGRRLEPLNQINIGDRKAADFETGNCEPRRHEVPENVQCLTKGITGLQERIGILEDKLSPVLRSQPENVCGGDAPPSACELGAALRTQANFVESLIERVDSMIYRLEL